MIRTIEEWHSLSDIDRRSKLNGWEELPSEEKEIIKKAFDKESEERQKLLEIQKEARRFVAMDLIVRAEQGKQYEPTEQARHMVKKMTAFGIPMKNVADVIGVGVSSLQKHFKDELATGHTEANFMVANTLFQMAINGNVTACIFWMKTRLGWKDESPSDRGDAGKRVLPRDSPPHEFDQQ